MFGVEGTLCKTQMGFSDCLESVKLNTVNYNNINLLTS